MGFQEGYISAVNLQDMVRQPGFQQFHGIKPDVFALLELQQQLHDLGGEAVVLRFVSCVFPIAEAQEELFFEHEVVHGVVDQPFENAANKGAVGGFLTQLIVQAVSGVDQPAMLEIDGFYPELQGFGPGHERHGCSPLKFA